MQVSQAIEAASLEYNEGHASYDIHAPSKKLYILYGFEQLFLNCLHPFGSKQLKH